MLDDLRELVLQFVRDDSGRISNDDADAAIGLAVLRYSQDRPRYYVDDLPANATSELALPSGWTADFSKLVRAEYPIDSFPSSLIEHDQYGVVQTPSAQALRFAFVPESAVRITYTRAHAVSDTEDTTYPFHREGIACWAAAILLDQLAAFYAGQTDSTLQADVVNRVSPAKAYAELAKQLRARYFKEIGVQEDKVSAAGTVVDLDLKNSLGGDRLTHPNRYR